MNRIFAGPVDWLVRHATSAQAVIVGAVEHGDIPVSSRSRGERPATAGRGHVPQTGDEDLMRLALAHPERAFPRGGALAVAHNAHYADSRAQVAFALGRSYNCLECDVRMRAGIPVLAHDHDAASDLTFEQWARIVSASGRMLRIDLKEASAIPSVQAIIDRLGIPHDRVTFNVSVDAPWQASNVDVYSLRLLRARYPESWITLNMPLPTRLGAWLLARAGRSIGGKVAGTLTDPLVSAGLISSMHRGLAIDVWNEPRIWQPGDVDSEVQRLRGLGVDGMIDLRRRDDPLASPNGTPTAT